MRDVSELLEDAAKIDSQSLMHLITRVDRTLSAEKNQVGKLRIDGRLIHMPPSGEVIVVGDLHGDLAGLGHILTETEFIEEASRNKEVYIVFLGDYGDRGIHSAEVYYVVLSLKDAYPDKVVLIQGNHEGPEDLHAEPHDLPYELQKKFGADWQTIYRELSHLFRRFYTAILIEERCIMLHGGVPSRAKSLADVAHAHELHPAESHLEEILWSDPVEGFTGTYPSPRGAGYLFGEDVTNDFLRILNVRFLVRGHEPADEGYKINHGGKVLTIFSRKGPTYFNRHGAFLTFDLSRVFDSARQLEPFIRKF
ncbi:MAG: metallophosphoesterase family protein [Nitrososphaerota archaeon]